MVALDRFEKMDAETFQLVGSGAGEESVIGLRHKSRDEGRGKPTAAETRHANGFEKNGIVTYDATPRMQLMSPARHGFKLRLCRRAVSRFAKDAPFEAKRLICAGHEPAWPFRADLQGLGAR